MVEERSHDVVLVQPPVTGQELPLLLWHKGSPWVEDIQRRLEGKCAGSRDRFLVIYDGPRPAAHVWYTVAEADPTLGLLGHVYTRPDRRRQGGASRLLQAAWARFEREGGRAMQLFTYNPATVPFYQRLGFELVHTSRSAHAQDWYMRRAAGGAGEIEARFAASECSIRPLGCGDLPQYCLLYNTEYGTRLKDRAQGIGLGLEAELAFINTCDRMARGAAACRVLDNGRTIVGIAALGCCDFPHQSHVGLVDYYTHPAFAAHAPALTEALLGERARLGVDVAYAMTVDEGKRATFARLGFKDRTRLERHYRVEGERLDCYLQQG